MGCCRRTRNLGRPNLSFFLLPPPKAVPIGRQRRRSPGRRENSRRRRVFREYIYNRILKIYSRELAVQSAPCVHMFVCLTSYAPTELSESQCAGVNLRYSTRVCGLRCTRRTLFGILITQTKFGL